MRTLLILLAMPVVATADGPTDWAFPSEKANGRNIKWAVATGGSRSLGGPVVADGLVWVGTNDFLPAEDPTKKRNYAVLACFRESDGKLVYERRTPRLNGDHFDAWWHPLCGSPRVEGDHLWYVTNRREVVSLDIGPLNQGKEPRELWTLDLPKELKVFPRGYHTAGHDMHGSLAAYKDYLYAFTGNGMNADFSGVPAPAAPSLVCLRKDTGKVVWQDNSPGDRMLPGLYGSPVVAEVNGRPQVIHPQSDGWVRAFDALTGKLLWKFDVNRKAAKGFAGLGDGERAGVVAAPTVANGRVYFATGVDAEVCNGPGRLFCIDPTKAGDVSPELDDGPGKGKPNPNSAVVWEYTSDGVERMQLTMGSVAVSGGFVVAADVSAVHCFDERTGKRLWTEKLDGELLGGALIVDGKIYAATTGGTAYVLDLAKTKRLIAKIEKNDGWFTAPPAFANGTLYLLSNATLYAIGPKR